MPYLERVNDVFVLFLGTRGEEENENSFNPRWIEDVGALLDEVEAHEGPAALVTTATGKFYSTGADLTWGMDNLAQVNSFIDQVHALLARLLSLPMQTVAALQGHTFGAAAFMAAAHDHRIMRVDRGYLCFPDVTIGANYSPGTVQMVGAKLPQAAFHEALTTGHRYGGEEALTVGLVDDTAGEDDLLGMAVERAQSLAVTRGRSLGEIKKTMYAQVLYSLQVAVADAESQEWSSRA